MSCKNTDFKKDKGAIQIKKSETLKYLIPL